MAAGSWCPFGRPRRSTSARTTASLCACVMRGVDQRERAIARPLSEGCEPWTLAAELVDVAPTELLKASRVMPEPLPELRARGQLLLPVIELGLLARDPTRPQPVDQHAIPVRWGSAGSYARFSRTSMGIQRPPESISYRLALRPSDSTRQRRHREMHDCTHCRSCGRRRGWIHGSARNPPLPECAWDSCSDGAWRFRRTAPRRRVSRLAAGTVWHGGRARRRLSSACTRYCCAPPASRSLAGGGPLCSAGLNELDDLAVAGGRRRPRRDHDQAAHLQGR